MESRDGKLRRGRFLCEALSARQFKEPYIILKAKEKLDNKKTKQYLIKGCDKQSSLKP